MELVNATNHYHQQDAKAEQLPLICPLIYSLRSADGAHAACEDRGLSVSPARLVLWAAGTYCCSGCRPTASGSTFCGPPEPPGCPWSARRWRPGAASRLCEDGCCWSPPPTRRLCGPREVPNWCPRCPTATPCLHRPLPRRCPAGRENHLDSAHLFKSVTSSPLFVFSCVHINSISNPFKRSFYECLW